MSSVVPARSRTELNDVRSLMRQFVAWHRQLHAEDIALVERYFDRDAFEQELAGLPGDYAPPKGRLLIAYRAGRPVGCVALRDLGDRICEMKRMFVPPEFRGIGIGRALADSVLMEARAAGYERMRLDTGKRQAEAIRLYESAEFRRIPAYHGLSAELQAWLVCFELDLGPER